MRLHKGVLKLTAIAAVMWAVGAVAVIQYQLYKFNEREKVDVWAKLSSLQCELAVITQQTLPRNCGWYLEVQSWKSALKFWPVVPSLLIILGGTAIAWVMAKDFKPDK
jgi:hypothetical protein